MPSENVKAHLGTEATEICDALSAEKYAEAAIPGTTNVFYENAFDPDMDGVLHDAERLKTMFADAGVTMDKEVIFYCGGGWHSAHNYYVARTLGYEKVRLYDGSRKDWIPRGGEMLPAGGTQ